LSDGTESYVYGPSGLPVEQVNSTTGAIAYLHHDQQGSTRLITGSTGAVEGKCRYAAYGIPTCEGAATTLLGYDAQYTSSDTGLIYMRARVYDPYTAQFMSVDPLMPVTQEPYAYVGDSPLNRSDPTGLGGSVIEEFIASHRVEIGIGLGLIATGASFTALVVGVPVGAWGAVAVLGGVGILAGGLDLALDASACFAHPESTGACTATALGAVAVLAALPALVAGGGPLSQGVFALAIASFFAGDTALLADLGERIYNDHFVASPCHGGP
jgi:RHS repeat-associated protein